MSSSTELLLLGLKAQLVAWFGNPAHWDTVANGAVDVARNISVPETIPAGGSIILRDGKVINKDYVLGSRTVFYSREVEIEAYVENANETARDAAYDLLTVAIGACIESDTTIGGTALGCLYDRDEQPIHPVDGGDGIKAGMIKPIFDYTAATPLS